MTGGGYRSVATGALLAEPHEQDPHQNHKRNRHFLMYDRWWSQRCYWWFVGRTSQARTPPHHDRKHNHHFLMYDRWWLSQRCYWWFVGSTSQARTPPHHDRKRNRHFLMYDRWWLSQCCYWWFVVAEPHEQELLRTTITSKRNRMKGGGYRSVASDVLFHQR